jgi:hypothetical protein
MSGIPYYTEVPGNDHIVVLIQGAPELSFIGYKTFRSKSHAVGPVCVACYENSHVSQHPSTDTSMNRLIITELFHSIVMKLVLRNICYCLAIFDY